MSQWKEILSQNDIDELLDTYGDFHDSCIVSMNYQSGAFVDGKGAMHFGNPVEHNLSVVFHSQWAPKAIELYFTGLRQLHLAGWQDHYVGNLSDAYLSFHDGLLPGEPQKLILWADYGDFDIGQIDNAIHEPSGTYVVSNSLKWRVIDG